VIDSVFTIYIHVGSLFLYFFTYNFISWNKNHEKVYSIIQQKLQSRTRSQHWPQTLKTLIPWQRKIKKTSDLIEVPNSIIQGFVNARKSPFRVWYREAITLIRDWWTNPAGLNFEIKQHACVRTSFSQRFKVDQSASVHVNVRHRRVSLFLHTLNPILTCTS
jgi:hypothetical protein